MKTRQKKVLITGISREQAEEAFGAYAEADARAQKITAAMDVQFAKIREKHSEEMQKLTDIKEKNFEIMQAFGVENKEALFSKKKSMEMVHGVLGFRIGTPKLKTLKGFTWGAVTNLLKEFLPGYIRTSEEPAKDKLLADREVEEVAEMFPKVGIFVDQDEAFYVEPKKEEVAA